MPRFPRRRATPRGLLAGAALLAAAVSCDRLRSPAQADDAPPTSHASVRCTAALAPAAIRCVADTARVAAPLAGPAAELVLGGQDQNVRITPANPSYADGVFSFDATVQNLIAQPIGTADGAAAAPAGVRVFFVAAPAATAGSGPIDFTDPAGGGPLVDGRAAFTAPDQPFYRYDAMLDSGAVSAPKRWRIHVPATVGAFAFSVYVSAPVRWPAGWVTVTPGAPALAAGARTTLAAAVRDAFGRREDGPDVEWSSAAPAVATVNPVTGVVTGVAPGTATVAAAAGARTGSVTVAVVPAGTVGFSVNTASRFPISRFIYGMNFSTEPRSWGGAETPREVTLDRIGGNRMTAYNWENNYSNAGNDYIFNNDELMSASREPGAALKGPVEAARARGAGVILTVPMLGYVAADGNGPVTHTDADRATRLATRFRVSRASKGAPFTLAPNAADGFVYQDEFVNWVNATFPGAVADPTRPIFFCLDNEPDIWNSTHAEIFGNVHDDPKTPRLFTYDEFADTTILYARAIKAVVPQATVFGPGTATYTGLVAGDRYQGQWFDDPKHGRGNFTEVYLDRLRQAESTYGRRLLDVFDLHWYVEAGTSNGRVTDDAATQDTAMIAKRLQVPRSLWDPTYDEGSWVNSVTGGPIRLIPRLREQVAAHYPGTRLAITEYYYGRAADISGGLAQADVLGIFGREGLFAATLWPNANVGLFGGDGNRAWAYAFGAFRLFLNYDGAGGRFGDTGVAASTTDAVGTSVYASLDAAGRVVVVAINKSQTASTPATIRVADPRALRAVGVWRMADGSPNPAPVAPSSVTAPGPNSFSYTMPALSATVIVLAP